MNRESMRTKETELTVELNVVIFPDDESRKKIIEWSSVIADGYPSYFTLNNKNYLPHLSLYNSQYPLKNQGTIEKIVKDAASKQEPFDIYLSGFSAFSGFVFYDVEPNNTLQKLHESFVSKLNPLREGNMPDVLNTLSGISEKQMKAIEEYGSVSVMDLYMPHVTLSRLINPDLAKDAIKLLSNKRMRFTAHEVSLTPFAEHGTCPQLLLTYPLNSS